MRFQSPQSTARVGAGWINGLLWGMLKAEEISTLLLFTDFNFFPEKPDASFCFFRLFDVCFFRSIVRSGSGSDGGDLDL